AIVAVGFYTASRPSIYSVPSSFWTSSPTWFAIRTGVLMLSLSALFEIPARSAGGSDWDGWLVGTLESWQSPLALLGRASLFVYSIPVELVSGYASWLGRLRLPVWASIAACAAFVVLMYSVVDARDRVLARRAARIPQAAALSQA